MNIAPLNINGVESKSNNGSPHFIKALWGNRSCDYAIKKPDGLSGGIIAIWDDSMFSKHNVVVVDGVLAIYGEWTKHGINCLMVVVYAPQDIRKKQTFWKNITNLVLRFNAHSVVLGDFNDVRYETERKGSRFCKRGAKLFNDFIYNSHLVDLPMGGRKFT
ncbi:cytochrome P450, partial [Tanacetum coccineum]